MNTKKQVDVVLSNLIVISNVVEESAKKLLGELEDYYETIEDDDFPYKQNIYRFIQRYKTVFTERTLSLSKEIETLCKDWQLKAGSFNKETGEWEYKE